MKTLEEVKKRIKIIGGIIDHIKLYEYDVQFFNDAPDHIIEEVLIKDRFFWRIKHYSYVVLCLELHKVLSSSKGDQYTLNKLIQTLINSYRTGEWKQKITLDELTEMKREIDKVVSSQIFKSLKNARHKYYAHLDPNRNRFDTAVNLKELNSLIHQIQMIRNRLTKRLFGFSTFPEFDQHDVGHYIFDFLYRFRKIDSHVINSKLVPGEFEKLSDIHRLLRDPIEEIKQD